MHAWAVACSTNFEFFVARRLQVLSHAGVGEVCVLLCVRKPLSTQQIMWSKISCSRFPIRHRTHTQDSAAAAQLHWYSDMQTFLFFLYSIAVHLRVQFVML